MKTAVYVNVKNETRLAEFIDYYAKIGIDYFVIMDDDILCYRKKEISELKDVMYNVQIILFR
jgi:hypothetical protein